MAMCSIHPKKTKANDTRNDHQSLHSDTRGITPMRKDAVQGQR
eukprot:CAMPEP_0196818866 /NCGR_PEP_ID=MMETSP1362-20130617/67860_1 /TAXON_ID=163516 /ORGANISM="Leptocylindrus danicus, Strain CCMP1856" /LENGTH=42 /DNA_ID= /DNA_START= /DNA_END= /DNA_ORIENTATION=